MIHKKLLSQKITIVNDLGIHARPAAMIAKLAQKAEKIVWIESNGNKADASSIIDILSIGGNKGSILMLKVESESDIKILDSIIQLVQNGFGENDE